MYIYICEYVWCVRRDMYVYDFMKSTCISVHV